MRAIFVVFLALLAATLLRSLRLTVNQLPTRIGGRASATLNCGTSPKRE
jgi:hypothetical protein